MEKPTPETLRFLNMLPTDSDPEMWLLGFRSRLLELLEEADHVIVMIHLNCDLRDPTPPVPELPGKRGENGPWDPNSRFMITESMPLNARTPFEQIIRESYQAAYASKAYHLPAIYHYWYDDRGFLGSILLLREHQKEPISDPTLALMKSLESFFEFMLSDAITRFHFAKRVPQDFSEKCAEIASDFNLTTKELEVLPFHLFGFTYNEIAKKLNITPEAVKRRILHIHRKAGVNSYTDLFAQYFSPLLVYRKKKGK